MTAATSYQHPDVGRVLGSYRILGLLGQGAMGLVFLAEHVYLGRKVALKKLKERFAAMPEAIESFFNEAQVVNQIGHPNIVEITDFVAEEGSAYYIMELLEGQSLAQLIETQGPLAARRAFHIADQIADALDAVHGKGVVHADIKPSNIFITHKQDQQDFVKVVDFGLAHLHQAANPVNPAAVKPTSSLPGMSLAGTPLYMAPEQADGNTSHLSDIYSLGVVCYHMLAGQTPFEAASAPELMYKHMHVAPQRLTRMNGHRGRKIPAKCSRVVMRCLEKDPAARPQSASMLKEELRRATASSGLRFDSGARPALEEPQKSPRFWAILGGLCVLALVGIGAGLYFLFGPEETEKQHLPNRKVQDPAPHARSTKNRKVRLTIKTAVPGAEVLRTRPGESLLGVTPLILDLPRKKETWTIRVGRSNGASRSFEVTLDENQTIVLDLEAENQKAPKKEATEGKSPQPLADEREPRRKSPSREDDEKRRERPDATHRTKQKRNRDGNRKRKRKRKRARTDTVDPFAM
jgi:serine/threonine-protein kinase